MQRMLIFACIFYLSLGFQMIEQEFFKFEEDDLPFENEQVETQTGSESQTDVTFETTDTQEETTVPGQEELTTEQDEDDEGLSDGEIAAIVICSVAGTALIAGVAYFIYSRRSPGEDLAFASSTENGLNNYGASEHETNAHSNPVYDHTSENRSSQYLSGDEVSGKFKSTPL